MQKFRRYALAILVCLLIMTSFGCGKTADGTKEVQEKVSVSNAFGSWFSFNTPIYGQSSPEALELQAPDKKLDVKSVYEKLNYTAEMFWGRYRLDHKGDGYAVDEPTQEFLDTCEWTESASYIGQSNTFESCSTLPYMFVSGAKETDERLAYATDHNWCCLYFATKHSDVETTYNCVEKEASYEIVGNKITFMILEKWDYNSQTDSVSYTFSPYVITFDFSFDGPQLTLSTNGAKVELVADYFLNDSEQSFILTGKSMDESTTIDNIDSITISTVGDTIFMVADDANGDGSASTKFSSNVAQLDDTGLLTFNYEDENGVLHKEQYVIFCCGKNGMILTDGETNHYYMSEFLQFEFSFYDQVAEINNISEKDKEEFKGLSSEEVETIIETRSDLLTDLTDAFSKKGIDATINPDTGEITLASQILFETGESEVSELGMQVLGQFINAFAEVTAMNEYEGFIKSVAVQGHTDTAGDYDSNQVLSEERANTVLQCCLDSLQNPGDKDRIAGLLYPEGCSYNYPVLKDDGTVDMDASRRVVFVFFIDLSYGKK